jgi:asparagine synthase (glutamine-hydrolysing)
MRGCVKVALTGVGGDELFGNYGKWISSEMRIRKISRLPSLSRYLVNHDFLYNAEQNILNDRQEFRLRYFEGNYYLRDEEREHLLLNSAGKLQSTADYLFDLHGAGRAFKARDSAALLDFETQLPDEFLLMTDRFSMFHSIEARTPFLDNELVNLVLQIPADKRTKLTDPKYLLRQALTGVLPAKIISSPKRGFTAPISDWLRGPLSQVTEELLSPAALESGGIFNPAVYARFVKPHLDGTRDFSTRVWSLLMFELWRSNFQAHT